MPLFDVTPQTAASSYDWIECFYKNAPEPILPWNDAYRLSEAERAAVITSIQQFQLGESGDGRHLFHVAESWTRRTGDRGYVPALRLFVREEQRHSRMLGRFLDREGAPWLQHHWTQSAFRRIRNLAGFELCMRVLASAEILALPYYSALQHATRSTLLDAICARILKEEAAHLHFQAFTFKLLEKDRTPALRWLTHVLHCGFLLVTALIVWLEHRPVFRRAGCSFGKICRQSLATFRQLAGHASLQELRKKVTLSSPGEFTPNARTGP
jgi:hypothetical protein